MAFEHGHARKGQIHPLHRVWRSMIQRCTNPKDPRWSTYGARGARGVRVCERWVGSFAAFLEDVGPRPEGKSPGGRAVYSLDRIDNDRGYEPGNVRWATNLEQSKKTTRSRMLTAFGKTQNLVDWARELGVHHTTILGRLKRGWSEDQAVTEPTR